MPFVFLIIGTVFIIAGVRNTTSDLVSLFQDDIKGDNNFVYWILAILAIGALGYVQDLRPLSRAFLVLVLIVLVLSEDKSATAGGFFTKFQQGITSITGGTTS